MVSLSGPKLQPSSLETRVRILYYVLSMLDYKRGIEMLNRLINMKRDKTDALDDLLESNKLSISDKENQSGFYTG